MTGASAQARDAARTAATARISGRVVAGDTGAPVDGTVVVLTALGGTQGSTTTTDGRGAYRFTALTPGEYRITAMPPSFRRRYLPSHYGATTPHESGAAVRVGAGDALENLDITLPVAAALGGRVVDEAGEPLSGIEVGLLRPSQGAGVLEPGGVRPASTDDQGRFRLFGLMEGEYLVIARPDRPHLPGAAPTVPVLVPTLYPSALSEAEAARVVLEPGQEIDGLEIRVVRSRTYRITGAIVTSDGRALANVYVSLTRLTAVGDQGGEQVRVDGAGRFEASGLAPGDYTIAVGPSGPLEEFARLPLTIADADVKDVTIVTRPSVSIAGRVVFDEPTPAGDLPAVRVQAIGIDPDTRKQWIPHFAAAGRDGSFTLSRLTMPVLVRAGAPAGWMLKAVLLGGVDITDRPTELTPSDSGRLDVILTRRRAVIAGRVRGEAGRPITDCVVLLFSASSADWVRHSTRVQLASILSGGEFTFTDVRPGTYRVVGVPHARIAGTALERPALLESLLSDAAEVTVGEDERREVEVRLVR